MYPHCLSFNGAISAQAVKSFSDLPAGEGGSELLCLQQFNLIPLMSHSLSATTSDPITWMSDQSGVI